METEKYLSDIQAIKETMLVVEDDILKQAKNPNNWGLAKSLFSGMPLSKNTTSKQEELLCDDLSEKKQPRQAHEINTLDDIIDDLRYWTRGFPEAAINAAINQKAKITPMLIALLEETLQGYQQLVEQDFFGHLYALFLLASFREKKAFPLAIKIAILPDDWPDQLLGDTITEDFHRILASLYDGNLKALQSLIENPNVDHWSRNAALKTLLLLVKENIVERTWVVNYLKGLFHHPAFIEDDEASTCLVNAACDIYPEELYTDIQDAFRRNKVDTWSIDLKWVDEVIALGKEAALDRELYKNPHMTLIDDVIENMKWWACFQEETHKPMLPMHHEANNDKLVWSNEPQVSITYRRDTPKMGRNEPCPCGSGKKYKKCCLMQTVH